MRRFIRHPVGVPVEIGANPPDGVPPEDAPSPARRADP